MWEKLNQIGLGIKFIWEKFNQIFYYYPHELCHYGTALLLGLKAELHPRYVRTWSVKGWQRVIIALSPSIAGLVFWLWLILLDYHRGLWYLTVGGLALNLFWQYSCKSDFKRIWHYLQTGI